MKHADVTNVVSLTLVGPFLSLTLSFDIVIPPRCHEDVGVVVGGTGVVLCNVYQVTTTLSSCWPVMGQ